MKDKTKYNKMKVQLCLNFQFLLEPFQCQSEHAIWGLMLMGFRAS